MMMGRCTSYECEKQHYSDNGSDQEEDSSNFCSYTRSNTMMKKVTNDIHYKRRKENIIHQYQKRRSNLSSMAQIIVVVILALFVIIDDVSGERAYPLGCSNQPTSYYDYINNKKFPPDNVIVKTTDDYMLVRRLGTGKFSDVFEAVDVAKEEAILLENKNKNEDDDDDNDDRSPILIYPSSLVVIKCLKPVSERKIRRELLVLGHASNLPNLVKLEGLVIPEHYEYSQKASTMMLPKMPSLILQHAGINSQWFCHPGTANKSISSNSNNKKSNDNDMFLNEYEMKYFLFHLLVALDALHSKGIMHRDVKPRNVLINRFKAAAAVRSRKKRTSISPTSTTTNTDVVGSHGSNALMLIDLGLADFYLPPPVKYNVRVASRHYKSPELLIGYEYYDYAIDMWGVGCILVGLLLRREPFFRGKDNLDQLLKIMTILGTSDLLLYISKYKIEVLPEVRTLITQYHKTTTIPMNNNNNSNNNIKQHTTTMTVVPSKRQSFLHYRNAGCPIPSRDGIDLLDKLLVYDHDQRLTAKQAMDHPFFDAVRERVLDEVKQQYYQ